MRISSLIAGAPTIVVMGDVMLDLYLSGRVDRISPEAPVPVLHYVEEEVRAGGAANVALNVARLGGRVRLLGLIGEDESGGRLRDVLRPFGLAGDLVADGALQTVTKTRVLADGQHQFLRIDRERAAAPSAAVAGRVQAALEVALDGAGALVLSDYAKGFLSDAVLGRAVAAAKAAGVPVFVDPKRDDFEAYAGAAVIKPNLAELSRATGLDCRDEDRLRDALDRIGARVGADVLLTMSDKGMLYHRAAGGEPVRMATRAREVFDVSGAGDTVMAVFATLRVAGASVETAMHAANVAAGLAVAKVGTAAVGADELEAALARDAEGPVGHGPGAEILDRAAAAARCAQWRRAGLSVGFTNGCFDLLHPGHIRILRDAAAACDRLVVGLNTDASVSALKGPARPVQDEAARACVMAAIAGVDAVTLFDEETPLALIQALRPDVLVKGADYAVADIVGAEFVLARGGRVERVPLEDGHSTTALISRSRTPA